MSKRPLLCISGWLNLWQAHGLAGSSDAPKWGRCRMDVSLEAELLDLLQNPTPDLKAVVQAHLRKSNRGHLDHRKALPQAAGFHLPPRSARPAQNAS